MSCKRRWRFSLLPVLMALALGACGGADDTGSGGGGGGGGGDDRLASIKIGVSTWIGFAPLALAEQQGFWKERGLDARIVRIEDATERFAAMRTGDTQAAATTVDSWARYAGLGEDAKLVLGTAESSGGDGIVAEKAITSIADLEGKRVAVQLGITSQFLLAYALEQNGLSMDDVEVVDMDAGAAGSAFAAGRVPAAVTWQPWLTKAEQSESGHVLATSRDYPGLLIDTIGFPAAFIEENGDAVGAFIEGYLDALRFMQTNPEEANAAMAEFTGLELDEFTAALEDVRFLTEDEIRTYFQEDSDVGVYNSFDSAAKFWVDTDVIQTAPPARDHVDGSFIDRFVK